MSHNSTTPFYPSLYSINFKQSAVKTQFPHFPPTFYPITLTQCAANTKIPTPLPPFIQSH